MKINYCEKCHNKKRAGSYEKFVNEIKKKNEDIHIENECQSTCGPGKNNFIAGIEDEIIIEKDQEKFVKEVNEKIKKGK